MERAFVPLMMGLCIEWAPRGEEEGTTEEGEEERGGEGEGMGHFPHSL